jgi:hypothetical protein
MRKLQVLTILLVLLLGITVTQAQDNYGDGRINQVSHFGGDALYCEAGVGCWVLDKNGNQLWDISQAAIDELFEQACESGTSVYQDVGVGTYGMMTFHISCYEGLPKTLELFGYDEWGKINSVKFATSYEPIGAVEPVYFCQMQFFLLTRQVNKGGDIAGGSTPSVYRLFESDAQLVPLTYEILATSTTPFEDVPVCNVKVSLPG